MSKADQILNEASWCLVLLARGGREYDSTPFPSFSSVKNSKDMISKVAFSRWGHILRNGMLLSIRAGNSNGEEQARFEVQNGLLKDIN